MNIFDIFNSRTLDSKTNDLIRDAQVADELSNKLKETHETIISNRIIDYNPVYNYTSIGITILLNTYGIYLPAII